jgi:hypothetical protein
VAGENTSWEGLADDPEVETESSLTKWLTALGEARTTPLFSLLLLKFDSVQNSQTLAHGEIQVSFTYLGYAPCLSFI